jgi:hypothetical protein
MPSHEQIYAIMYIHYVYKEPEMKITRRSENGKSGHLLISVPASRVAEIEAALTFLEGKRQQRGSQVIIDLIVRAALRNGWQPLPRADASPDGSGVHTTS